MLKKLLSALFGRKKQEAEHDKPKHRETTAIRREARRRNATPAASRSTSSSQAARQDDAMTNPLHPLHPANAIGSETPSCRAYEPERSSYCDDSTRNSSGNSTCSPGDSGNYSSSSSSPSNDY